MIEKERAEILHPYQRPFRHEFQDCPRLHYFADGIDSGHDTAVVLVYASRKSGPYVDVVFVDFGRLFVIEVVAADLHQASRRLGVTEDSVQHLFDSRRGSGQAGRVLDRKANCGDKCRGKKVSMKHNLLLGPWEMVTLKFEPTFAVGNFQR